MDNKKIIGNRINEALALRDKKQKELATVLNVTDNTISYFCSGARTPNTHQIMEISKYLSVSSDYLLGLTKYPTSDKDKAFICEYTGLSEGAICSITEYWKDIPEEWQKSKVVLSAFMESITLFNILSYIFDYKEEFLRKYDLEKQAEQAFEKARELSKKQQDDGCDEIIVPRKEELKFLRDNDYYDIQDKCDIYLYRAQRLFSKFVEDYAMEGCDDGKHTGAKK